MLFNIAYIIDYLINFVSMNIIKNKKCIETIKQNNSLKTKKFFVIPNIMENIIY